MDQLTVADVTQAFDGITGITLDEVLGIRLMVVSQVEFSAGYTSRAAILLKQKYHYLRNGVPGEASALYVDSDAFISLFDHDDVRDGEPITATEIKGCFDSELLDLIKKHEWKVFWGDSENGHVEVGDFWKEKPTQLYFFGQTHDT